MKPRILVIDDEDTIRECLCTLFTEEGFDCSPARDGTEAINKCSGRKYDFIILDFVLPKMHGLEVLKKLRKNQKGAQIIVLTAYDDVESAAEAYDLGVSKVLIKPVDFDELLSHLEDLGRS